MSESTTPTPKAKQAGKSGQHPARRASNRAQVFWDRLHPDTVGLLVGTMFFALALTPSLLPRDALYQGVVCGLCAATGYLIGVFARWNWNAWIQEFLLPVWKKRRLRLGSTWRRRIEGALLIAALAWLAGMVLFSVRWQRQVAQYTDARELSTAEYFLVFPIGIGLWLLLGLVGRGINIATDFLIEHGPKRLDVGVRTVSAWIGVGIVGLVIFNQVVPGTIVSMGEAVFAPRNSQIREDLVQPNNPERSGSPDSINDWEGLGAFGTRFVGLGLHKEELSALSGRPSKEPIRVYSGLEHGQDDAERAQRVVEELKRTHAEDRKVVMVATTTGTGWVNPTAAQALELLYDGDTAIAAAQYSYLPSGVQFIANTDVVREAGQTLISAVQEWWNELDPESRPKLLIYGESLGVVAGEGAFSGLQGLAQAADGVLWVGPPHSSTLWRNFVSRRDPGTYEADPEYAAGMVVRFAGTRQEVQENLGPQPLWQSTRVLYFQHATDPVVWWSPSTLLKEPDWLKEPAQFDRSPAMRWYPFITFFQLSLDLPVAANVPNGHGHNYGTAVMDGLAAISNEDRFDRDFVEQQRPLLEQAMQDQGPEKEIGVDNTKN
ncbi:alpha/beta hydrolase [Corynebacterium pseudopelargi]|uniref:Alpha/beta-hydrolase family protein n=1 Tax=Corynebacterium pseudopelargi TaxID=2080757 RepID=A0A3G6IV45_9CORY|nr:alpha/beta-hydrolase family protein [Corynebacterium pseudopelargi]AZA09651.1 hypothetical protein CPPEL_07715 [Corynebacterium pseudopelargi]